MDHKGTKIIETERLILRPFCEADGEFMFRNWAADPEVTKFLTWPAHENLQVSKQVVESWIKDNQNPKSYQWAVELNEIQDPKCSNHSLKHKRSCRPHQTCRTTR